MMNLPVSYKNNVAVMSSADLARLCVGDAKNAHSHFMEKAKKVLGDKLPNFRELEKYLRGEREILLLPEREACLMAMSYSYELQARVYDAWQELKKKAESNAGGGAINEALALAEVAARMLNMSNSSKLGMLQKVERKYGVPSILPSYAVDAPSDAADGSSRVTVSLTEMLKLNDARISVQAAYRALQSAGIVERRTRPSTGGTEKEFWALTTNGLLYGKNITSPNNPRQVQPHFYETKTSAILAITSSK